MTIPDRHVTEVCRPGAQRETCAYLTQHPTSGWMCAKLSPGIVAVIRSRLARGTMGAQGDHCSGPPDYTIPAQR